MFLHQEVEAVKSSKRGYSEATLNNTSFKFIIPVYDNMPEDVCAIPTGDGSPNNRLKDYMLMDIH